MWICQKVIFTENLYIQPSFFMFSATEVKRMGMCCNKIQRAKCMSDNKLMEQVLKLKYEYFECLISEHSS
jgi:hypothetical protein